MSTRKSKHFSSARFFSLSLSFLRSAAVRRKLEPSPLLDEPSRDTGLEEDERKEVVAFLAVGLGATNLDAFFFFTGESYEAADGVGEATSETTPVS
jgi:hypothetical protein